MNFLKTPSDRAWNRFSFVAMAIIVLNTIFYSCKKSTDDQSPKDSDGLTYTEVASKTDTPWQITFIPDGRILFTERIGRVRVIENGQLKSEPYLNLRDSTTEAGEAGLTGIIVDPAFNTNHFFYVAYTYEKSKNPLVFMNKVVRYREDPATKKPVFDKILVDGIEGYINHNVGSLHFGPDDKLYITTGERYMPDYAQDLKKLNGKILRINRDGSVPSDNPFPESLVYSLGHRNVQGLAWQPGTNNLFNVEHGPSLQQGCCMDEINYIQAGKNYGWPLIRGKQQQANLETPKYISGDDTTWAPAQAVFLETGPWAGSMLFTGLYDQALHRAVFDATDRTKVLRVETYMKEELGRLRAIAKGPDGKIYIATSNGDGRGIAKSPEDDRIFVLNIQP